VAHGVQIFETQGGTLHAKTAAFDDRYSIVGSANLNGRSRDQDSEVALGISDARVALELHERFDGGAEQARQIGAAELADEGAMTQFRQWFFSRFRSSL
jgi:phosphatidylserine/phosphatidylglycerophosphate/cardiolipin synthase-like enzyme